MSQKKIFILIVIWKIKRSQNQSWNTHTLQDCPNMKESVTEPLRRSITCRWLRGAQSVGSSAKPLLSECWLAERNRWSTKGSAVIRHRETGLQWEQRDRYVIPNRHRIENTDSVLEKYASLMQNYSFKTQELSQIQTKTELDLSEILNVQLLIKL